MFTSDHVYGVEEICFNLNHIEKNLKLINENFSIYFEQFMQSRDTSVLMQEEIEKYNKDREKYLYIMNEENLEIFKEDEEYFKNIVLKNECPIIHKILQYKKAKDYKDAFKKAKPSELWEAFKNLYVFSNNYNHSYEKIKSKKIENYAELEMDEIDEDKYSVRRVVGQGIKGYFLYKANPKFFSNRSIDAIWALWYLTGKQVEDCVQDSEFLRIEINKSTTNENYFYPYQLFHFYATKILELIQENASKYDLEILEEYRFVIVDAFLNYVTNQHIEEIEYFTRNSDEEKYYGY